jgi:8-oxo-dGTP pyrophosphatase MutT (NUDIX family)
MSNQPPNDLTQFRIRIPIRIDSDIEIENEIQNTIENKIENEIQNTIENKIENENEIYKKENHDFPSPIHTLSPIESINVQNYRITTTTEIATATATTDIEEIHEEDSSGVVLSVGIMAFSSDFEKILLVRRKDSMAYVEFIRGKYKPKDTKYLQFLLESMTKEEQMILSMTLSFEELWSKLWIIKTSKSFTKNFEIAKQKFYGCIHKIREWIPEFQRHSPPKYRLEPEWGIPKGRKNRYESNIHCALREFEEETGIITRSGSCEFILEYPITLGSAPSLEICYLGTNCIHYKLIVYPAICYREIVGIDPLNKHQQREISAVEWTSLELAKKRLQGIEIDYEKLMKDGLAFFGRF